MNNILNIASSVKASEYAFEFSICTLVTRKEEYNEMLQSFIDKGFSTNDCEYLFIDNSAGCTFDAYQGLNIFLQQAKGRYIILCHQDVVVHDQDRTHLAKRIKEIEERDKNWGILANAGGINLKWIGTNLTQGNGNVIKEKFLPLRTKTVDENFIIVKSSANLALSNDLSGFHLYGTDLCIIADILGYTAYIIDFNLTHKSDGNADKSFYSLKKSLIKKYNHALRSRFMCTTITRFYISGNWFTAIIYDTQFIKFFVKQYYKFFKTKKSYHLKKSD